jgi:zinc protease
MSRSHLRARIFVLAFLILNVALAPAQTSGPAKPKTPATKPAPAGAAAQQDAAAADLRAMKKPPLPEFHPQQPKRVQLANGMVVFLQEDHELPLINGTVYIYGGSKSEPGEKAGLVAIYGTAWRTGGTKTQSGDELDDKLEARAANVETSGGLDFAVVRLSCLKADFDFVLGVFNDILRNPEFRQEKIEIAKNAVKTGIARRNDDMGQIANRESGKIGYGPKSPYARVPEYASVAAVTRQDLLDWHSKYVHPNNIVFGIVGDFDAADMESKLRGAFEGWSKGPAYAAPQIAVEAPKPGIYFVAKDDVNQAEIRMVSSGIRRDDPDYYAVQVMNEVFGGGFASRLFQNLRTKAGLAYAVGGGINAPFDHPGLARLVMGTKSSTTAKAIEGLYQQIEDMHNVPVTPAELQRGKDAILNSFIFQFDSKDKVMQESMTYELYGYPANFLERYQKGVEKVTLADVDRVARKYLDKSKFAVLVVGKAADFDKPVSTFGPVTNIDITIPQPGASAAAPVTSNPEGRALLAKVIEAAGGEKLKSIKAIRTKFTLTLKAQGITLEAEVTAVPPDRVHTRMNTPGGELLLVIGPQESFMQMAAMGGVRPMPSSQRDDSLKGLRRNLWDVAQHADDPQYSFSARGTEKVGEVQASVLEIRGGGQQWRWYVDPQTGHILRAQYEGSGPTGPDTQSVDYSDWKAVDGITFPFHQEITVNGQPSATIVTSGYELNPTIDPKFFQKPEKAPEQK